MIIRFAARGPSVVASHPPVVAPEDRIYAIGDIHGRFDLLIDLLRRLEADARSFTDRRRPRFVFLGDYIDRGEQSKEVLKALSELAATGSDDLVFLLGNHEAALMDFLANPEENAGWLEFGGLQTLASLGIRKAAGALSRIDLLRIRSELVEELVPYRPLFERLRRSFSSGGVFFSHAGIDPSRTLEDQTDEALLWGQAVSLEDEPIKGMRIVHGHFDHMAPVSRPGRICVDTGAYYSGVLSAVRLDDGERILSARAP